MNSTCEEILEQWGLAPLINRFKGMYFLLEITYIHSPFDLRGILLRNFFYAQ